MSFVAGRRDYAYPLRIDGGSQQAAQAPYAAHVEQMIEQVLLTSPGERVDLPQFGCGLRRARVRADDGLARRRRSRSRSRRRSAAGWPVSST